MCQILPSDICYAQKIAQLLVITYTHHVSGQLQRHVVALRHGLEVHAVHRGKQLIQLWRVGGVKRLQSVHLHPVRQP